MTDKTEAMSHIKRALTPKVYETLREDLSQVTMKWHETFYVTLRTTYGSRHVEVFTSAYEGQNLDSPILYRRDTDVKKWDPSFVPNTWLPNAAFAYTCVTCEGTGVISCGDCRAKGEMPCGPCHGSGKTMCAYCLGTGYKSGHKSQTLCDRCTDGTMPCKVCGGKGRIPCETCSGRKHLTCGTCKGSRKLYQGLWLHQKEEERENVLAILAPEIERHVVIPPIKNVAFSREQILFEDGPLNHSLVILASKKLYGPAYHQMDRIEALLNTSQKHALDERILKQKIHLGIGHTALITYRYKNDSRWLVYDAQSDQYYFQKTKEIEEILRKPSVFEGFNVWWLSLGLFLGFVLSFFLYQFIFGS